MANSYDFESPDWEGYEYLLNAPLFLHEGMLFSGVAEKDRAKIEEAVTRYGRDEGQKYWNHIHMLPHCADVSMQRQWACELIDRYRERAAEICPDYILIGEIIDDGVDIELTFWIAARPRQS